ncbi:MAG: calcium-translocating P-type ATPase, PMCA-type [Bacteroidetes bacterium]|nr:calcium-translocating P-type ATPase, PMCA-type [Bacteroidota bacterium]MCL2301701.1 calcium-translocating P-type ATPase, PMCA-type [Lentimicrobiaceae bacterium]
MQTNHHYTGLTDAQVLESRKQHGENILTPPKKELIWKEFLKKFADPIIIILLVALVLSIGVACYEFFSGHAALSVFLEPTGILVAILLATAVGFFFELSANKKFEALNQVNDDTLIKVIRNGNVCQVFKKEVVVGDIVILEAGEEVPADGELLEAVSLQINESALTGEPIAKKTIHSSDFAKDATYPSNHALRGTTVADGHGMMQVLKVGDATEYGKVYIGAQIDNQVKTPLNKQLAKLAGLITKASYSIAVLIILGRLISYFVAAGGFYIDNWVTFGSYALNTVMIAVTLIVVSVPEGLPMSVTLSLALSMKRMLATNNLVRKMHACETMGAATIICTDKTGTLTQNKMKVSNYDFYDYNDSIDNKNHYSDIIYEGIAVNSTAFLDFSDKNNIKPLGNPSEGALLLWLHENNINYLPLREDAEVVEQLPFSTERKYMATIVQSPLLRKKILYVKGAPEIILDMCKKTPVEKDKILNQLLGYQNKAMRTLGFAYQIIEDDECYIKDERLNDVALSFLGFVAISDPVREDVPEAIRTCLNAGIDVKIITGDTPATAKEIGRQIGLWLDNEPETHHVTGAEFAAMSDESLLDRILSLKIMSRARPMDKQRLVQLLQSKNQVVAVTGDGTNDAPALKAAQVGLSMGDGTSVAKEASDITILDDSFSSISRAVTWGRSLYQNIQRFIVFQLTINVVACLIVLIGAFLGTETPLTVTQILWVNLIMDTFAALALASLPPNEKVMCDKPRKVTDHIITKKMAKNILGVGLVFVILLFGLLQYFKQADITSLTQFSITDFGRNFFNFSSGNGLSSYELSLFFTIFVMLQFWNMFNAKAFMAKKSAFMALSSSKIFLMVALLIILGQWAIVTFGGRMFSVTPLQTSDWIIIIVATSLVLWIGEIARMSKIRLMKI